MSNDDDVNADGTETLACSCCGGAETDGGRESGTGRWLDEASPLEAELPPELQAPLGRILGEPPVETLGAWLAAVRQRTGDGPIDAEHLCHADEETDHVGRLDGETYHFQCFYDAVALSALVDEPVDVRTKSPDGSVVEARAVGTDELRVTPEGATFSFGIAADVTPPADDEPFPADVYGAVCPYVRAFPDRDAYERWAETVPAATVGLPLAGATEVAAALAE